MEVATNVIKTGKAFLSTAMSVMSGVKTFLDIAGKAAEFIATFPIIGAAVNIFMQFLDIGVQIIEVVKQSIRIAKARKIAGQMKAKVGDALAENLREINMKRVKRAIIPLSSSIATIVADVISITGSILNIIGVATSAAHGAGVALMATGYAATGTSAAIKLGASLAKPIASGVRTIKQKGRDMAAKGKIAKGFKTAGGLFGTKGGQWSEKRGKSLEGTFNTEKTTEKKQQQYLKDTRELLKRIADLPDYDNSKKDDYDSIYQLVKATGVDKTELFANNNNPQKQVALLIEAMKMRE